MDTIKVGVLCGSLRKASFSKRVAVNVMEMLPEWMDAELMDISPLPLFNQDLDEEVPLAAYQDFREEAKAMQAFLFVTPEYNRSVPAVLKNALDIGSRPMAESVWSGKPVGIISVSPGALGGFGANHHLRQSLAFLNVYTMQQPECYLGNVAASIDENGLIATASAKDFLEKYAEAFTAWVKRFV